MLTVRQLEDLLMLVEDKDCYVNTADGYIGILRPAKRDSAYQSSGMIVGVIHNCEAVKCVQCAKDQSGFIPETPETRKLHADRQPFSDALTGMKAVRR